jgi:predicted RNA binding protein with dsRBD fold (UPF0201 family)
MPRPKFHLRVTAEAAVGLSEDSAKVGTAVANVLGECRHVVEEVPQMVRMTSDDSASILRLHDQLRDRHVRAAARKLLLAGREGNVSTVMLNRQAAYAGVLALCGSEAESPLGPIYLTIGSDELDDAIEWLTAYETG